MHPDRPARRPLPAWIAAVQSLLYHVGQAALITLLVVGAPATFGESTAVTANAPFQTVAKGFQQPTGVAVHPEGFLVLTDQQTGVLYRLRPAFTAAGAPAFTSEVLFAGLDEPVGVVVEPGGHLVVAEQDAGRLVRFVKLNGVFSAVPQSLAAGLKDPRWLAVDGQGNLVVSADGLKKEKLAKGTPKLEEEMLLTIGPDGALRVLADGFKELGGLSLDPAGNLFAGAKRRRGDKEKLAGTIFKIRLSDGLVSPVIKGGFAGPQDLELDGLGALFFTAKEIGEERESDEDDKDDREDSRSSDDHEPGKGIILKATFKEDSTFDRLTLFAGGLGKPEGLAFDRDGNLYVAEAKQGRVLRFEAPARPVLDPQLPLFTSQRTLTVRGTTIEPNARITILGGAHPATGLADPTSGTFSVEVSLQPNTKQTLRVFATGARGDGLTSQATEVDITHDDLPPDTIITGGPSGTLNTTTATFTFTASEDGSTFLCQLDAGTFAACTTPKSYIGLTSGPHIFRVKAHDQAGNEDPTPAERSFTVSLGNQPPILNPIGNKTVQLGNTLAFTVAATDPEGGFVSFAVTPLPLPAHAAFNAQSGEFVFTPDATQVGTFTLAFLASDGVASSSETITLIVTGAQPGGVTSLSGRVDDTSRNPVPNVTVALKGTILSTITDAQGQFTLTGIPATQVGRQQVVVTGFAQGYANLVAPVDLIANVTTQLHSPLTLPPIDTGTAVTVNPNVPTVVQSARLNVSVTIPPHTAKNADGTDYTGVLTISPVPEYGRPESRPVELRPGLAVTIQPAGVVMDPPVPITFSNVDNMPPGNELDLWSLSPDTGTFQLVGTMRVSADGQRIETISGGVRKTAWHFPLAPNPTPSDPQSAQQIGQCTTCQTGSGADLQEGALTLDHAIPGVRTLGLARNLTLHYRSTSADVRPIIPLDAFLSVRAAVPPSFSAQLTVGGIQQGPEVYWNASGLPENADSTSRLGVQFDASSFTTGRYPYEAMLFSNYPQSSIGGGVQSQVLVRNERASPIGAGWTLAGLDRIYPQADGALVLAEGTGATKSFSLPGGGVSWWPGEGNANDIQDGNPGTLQNGATFAAGKVGQAFSFDGIDDVVLVPDSASLNITGSLTLEGWINVGAYSPEFTPIISKWNDLGRNNRSFFLVVVPDGSLRFDISNTGGSATPGPLSGPAAFASSINGVLVSSAKVNLNTFAHVAATFDANTQTMRVFVNGVENGSLAVPFSTIFVQNEPVLIGASDTGGNVRDFLNGEIDEIAIYNRALSASEILAIFNAGSAGKPQTGTPGTVVADRAPAGDFSTLAKNADGTFTRTLKDGTTYQFNARGFQTSVSDRNGNVTTYAHDGSGRLTAITDPAGQVTTLTNSGGVVSAITDPAGRVTQLEHDGQGNLTAMTYADGSRASFTYDPQHRITKRTDARGQVTQYAYDFAGRFTQTTLPTGETRRLTPTQRAAVPNLAAGEGTKDFPAPLAPPSPPASFQDGNGHTSSFTLDALGRIATQTDALNRVTTTVRDSQGNPTTITRPNGAVTTMTYDAQGNLLTTTEQAISATTTFAYESTFNQVTSITDPKNNTTTITYDAKGNPLTITDADNKVTTLTYDSRGLVTSTKDVLNQTTTFTYDSLGRLTMTTDPLNRTTTLTYDAAGNVATSTDALNRVTSFQYDQKNRLKQVTDPAGGVTQYTYDGNGNLLSVKDAKNQTTTFTYDAKNRLASTSDPLGHTETYTYAGADNLITRLTPKGDTISFTYDAVNQLVKKTLPGNQVTSYTYDSVGNLAGVTDPDSTLTMGYDLANRLTSVSTAGSSNQPDVTLTHTYDKNGNRLTLTDPTGINRYTYDPLNRLMQLTQGLTPATPPSVLLDEPFDAENGGVGALNYTGFAQWTVTRGCVDLIGTGFLDFFPGNGLYVDLDGSCSQGGRLESKTLFALEPGTYQLTFSLGGSQRGDTNSVTVALGTEFQETFTLPSAAPLAPITRTITVPASTTARLSFDHAGGDNIGLILDAVRLSRQADPTAGSSFSYQYDALSRRTSVTLSNGTQTTYSYDPASQVTNILHQLTVPSTQVNKADYVYNTVGNRTSLTDRRGIQNFGYDALDRLTSATHPLTFDQTFTYDPVGNRTTNASLYNIGNQLTEDTTLTYTYDLNGNLTRKTFKSSGNHTDYTYDAENRLIREDEFAFGASTPFATSTYRYDGLGRRIEKVGNGLTRRYIFDAEDILLEYDETNTVQARYTHGPGIDEPLAMTRGGATFFYHQDGLGTVTDLTDSSGATAQSYAYDAWGNIIQQTGTVENPYTFTGREFDAETGLYYYRERNYDPRLGRFLQKDPIGFAGGINLYTYVLNNPIRLTDPFGMNQDCPPNCFLGYFECMANEVFDLVWLGLSEFNFRHEAFIEAAQRAPWSYSLSRGLPYPLKSGTVRRLIKNAKFARFAGTVFGVLDLLFLLEAEYKCLKEEYHCATSQ